MKRFRSEGIFKTKKEAERRLRIFKKYPSIQTVKITKILKPNKEGYKYRVFVKEK